MNKVLDIKHIILNPKEYNGQRVVTFKDIDAVHGRTEGTARKRFADNKSRFIEGVDYFVVTPKSLENTGMSEKRTSGIEDVNARGTTFVTETGYLMLVKSFTDDLAWAVQRELVNHYFKKKEMEKIDLTIEKAAFRPMMLSYIIDVMKSWNIYGYCELAKAINAICANEKCRS